MPVLIIAEAGVNHNASVDTAFRLVEAAAAAGSDIVKFQTAIPELALTGRAGMAAYQVSRGKPAESQLEMARRIHLPLEAFDPIAEHCRRCGIEFLSTAGEPVSLDFLAKRNPRFFKIPSGEVTNLLYLRQVAGYGKPVILSTGMASLDEVREAVEALVAAGLRKQQVIVLHCNTEYPTPMHDVNLRAMLTIRDELGVQVGYSDHTLGIEVPIAAVALGATVIEKHFTLDRNMPGPDHKASLEPSELRSMVAAIRNIEAALGDGVKRPSDSERPNQAIVRKSLVAARTIRAGELLSDENVVAKRAGAGISPMRWDEVSGRPARRDFAADEPIEL